ncbi:hypothetical protein BXT84_16190 [Sulfobacillus thermotolerans]|uniref:CRISPR-associated endonuclease Cas1 n=1 Tax=Sulfobacillus thermotolerans TaxID=338644 RepID=A0ABM6RVM4_9FIRM|nr:hypothetical protein BXT84_16190 [Sulfobacillus thermotolerans]
MTIQVRMLNEAVYCERLFHFMHVQGIFVENLETVEGTIQHERAEKHHRLKEGPDTDMPAPRTLMLGDPALEIIGKLDAVTLDDGEWLPVEEKHSASPAGQPEFAVQGHQLDPRAWPNDQIQLCAQGLLLRANGYRCRGGWLFYRGNRKKIFIEFSESLISATLAVINRAKEISLGPIPPPLTDSPKCPRCSLNSVCLPEEVEALKKEEPTTKVRLLTHRDDVGVLYASEPGTRLSKKSESIIVLPRTGSQIRIPMKDVSHISVIGPGVQLTTPLLHACGEQGIAVTFLSFGGRFMGQFIGPRGINPYLRRRQFSNFEQDRVRVKLAKEVIRAKVSNQRTFLRRNGGSSVAIPELKTVLTDIAIADSEDRIRGLEGYAARIYMAHFLDMIKVPVEIDGKRIMEGRNRRPPKDPVNALLSMGYSLLVRDVTVAISSVGLDPYFGFFHSLEPGRPALALDLVEPYRTLVGDSLAIRLLNTKEIKMEDFYWGPDACVLKPNGRRKYFAAYEQRMSEMITHPVFGYRLSYRRMLELDVRILGQYLMDDIPEYRALVTR